MDLDLQPVAAGGPATGLDLQPVPKAAPALDLQPVAAPSATGPAPALGPKLTPPPGFKSWEEYDQAGHEFTAGQNASDFMGALANRFIPPEAKTSPAAYFKALPAAANTIVESLGAHALNALRALNNQGMPWADRKVLQVTHDEQGRELWSEGAPPPIQPGKPLWVPQGTGVDPEGNGLQQFLSGLTTPGMVATFPFAEAKPIQAYYLSQTAPAALDAADRLLAPGGDFYQRKAAAADLAINTLMSFGLASGLARKPAPTPGAREPVPNAAPIEAAAPPAAEPSGAVSEFGGDTAKPLDLQPVAEVAAPPANGAKIPPPSAQLDLQPAAPSPKSNVKEAAAIPPKADISLKAGEDQPLPESVDTLNHQLDALRAGKKPAVLFTPGEAVPAWAQDSDQYATHETPAGTFLYDAAALTRDQIDQAVRDNTVGRILGYGIDAKPKAEDVVGAVTVRDPKGVEKQSVLTDQAHLEDVMNAAKQLAAPGDSVRLEDPAAVVAARAEAARPKPTQREIEAARVQENLDAVNALRAAKAAEKPGTVTLYRAENPNVKFEQVFNPEKLKEFEAAGRPGNFWTDDPEYADYFKESYGPGTTIRKIQIPADEAEKYQVNPGEYKIPADIESRGPNAINQRNQPVHPVEEHPGISPRPDLPADQGQIRKGAGRPAGGGRGRKREAVIPAQETEAALIGERPPDILDWIADNHPGGVRTTSREDYGEYVKDATGAARRILSNTKGERADVVIQNMHAQGLYRRIESEDDLLEAMLSAAEARKGWGKAPDRIENFLNDAIAASRARSAENAGKLFLRPDLGLSEPAYRVALQVIREAYVRLRDLAGAIEEGIAWLKANHPGFNEARTRAALTEDLRERATGQKILAAPGISDQTKAGINQYLYERRSQQDAQTVADGLLAHFGLETAQELWRGAWPELPGDVRAKLIGSVAREMRRQAAHADEAGKAQWAVREGQWWNEVLPKNTELGQYISALDGITDASPEGYVAKVRQEMEAAGAQEMERQQPATTILRSALDEGRAEGQDQLRRDPEANAAARNAVDGQILQDADQIGSPLHKGIIMELAEPWASSPVSLEAARKQVAAKADELLNRAPRPPGLTAPQHLRVILDDLAKRAAGIFAGHIQGADPGVGIVDKLMQRLGIDRPTAQRLATSLSKEWDRQLDLAKKALPTRLARQRARQLAGLGPDPSAPAVDRQLRAQLQAHNQSLGQLITQPPAQRAGARDHIADRIVEASGLAGPAADALRTKLRDRYDALVEAAQRRKLESLQAAATKAAAAAGRPAPAVRKPLQRAFDRLVELDRLAPVTGPAFYDVVKTALDLPRLTEADATALRAAVQKAQDEPAGFLRQRAMIEVMKLEGRIAEAGQPWYRKILGRGMAIFYANMLSGLTTYAKIPFENLNLFVAHTLLNYLTRPGELMHPIDYVRAIADAVKRGYAKGGLQALDTLRTGTLTGVYDLPKPPGPLESQPFGARMEPLNFWKWFTRAIGVAHEVTFKPAWEIKSTMLARQVARDEGLAGRQLDRRVAELLGNTEEHFAAAQAQAVDELARTGNPSALDLARRTREILEQQREAALPGLTKTARDYAQRVAYLNPSYGFLGAIGDNLVAGIERLRSQFPVLGAGVKSQIPFVKVATNIVNEKLNWTPLGLVRGLRAQREGVAYGRPLLDPNEVAELYAKGITGTIALGGLWALRAHIHGAGPNTPAHQHQLAQTGWIPHSVQIGGRYYSYDNTPLMLPLALIGAAEDWARYGKGDEQDATTRTVYALKGMAADLFTQGYLDSVGRVLEAMGNRNVSAGAGQLQKILTRTVGTAAVPNLLRQIDRLFDPTLRDQTSVRALIQAQIPFVRRTGDPVLNALGEPIQVPVFHHWISQATPDPLWQALAAQQAWVPEPAKDLQVGEKRLGPDYVRTITPDELYELTATAGPGIRSALEAHLNDGGPFDVASLPPGAARKLVQKVAGEQRAAALRQMHLTP